MFRKLPAVALICSRAFEFKRTKVNDAPPDLGDNHVGESVDAYMDSYPDYSMPSSFDAAIGYAACGGRSKIAFTPEPWNDPTGVDPSRIAGVDSADDILMVNPEGVTGPITP